VELGVEVKGPSVSVPEELFLESKPRLVARVRLVADDVLELDGDGVVEPREHHTVHQGPGRGRRGLDVIEDVVSESIAPKSEEGLPSPTRVVGGRRVQHDGHEGPDVVEFGSLCVEGGDVVGVESRGEVGLGSGQMGLMSHRRSAEDETLRRPFGRSEQRLWHTLAPVRGTWRARAPTRRPGQPGWWQW
jgi:hypothetical protein